MKTRSVSATRAVLGVALGVLAANSAACGDDAGDDGAGGGSTSAGTTTTATTTATTATTTGSGGSGGSGGDGGAGGGGVDLCADVECTASDACHLPGTCDPDTGECSDPVAPDGAECDDGDACTTDSCEAGTCVGAAVVCPATECQTAGTCDPATGECSAPTNLPDASDCACGLCSDGACLPKQLGGTTAPATANQPVDFDVDATSVYFGNLSSGFAALGSVGKLPIGGGQPEVLQAGLTNASAVSVADATLYFIDNVALWQVPADGSADATQVAAGSFRSVTNDGVNVYVTQANAGTVSSMPIGGDTLTPIASDEDSPTGIVTDGTNVYWIAGGSTIRQMAVAGGAIVDVADEVAPSALALDATNVYWTDSVAGTIETAPIGGGDVAEIASDQAAPRGITVANGNVYWTNYSNGISGTVARTSTAGGEEVVVYQTPDLNGPSSMESDAMCVYWVVTGSSAIWSAPL